MTKVKRANQGWCCVECGATRMNSIAAKQHDCAKQKAGFSKKAQNLKSAINGFHLQGSSPYKTYRP